MTVIRAESMERMEEALARLKAERDALDKGDLDGRERFGQKIERIQERLDRRREELAE